MQLQQTAHDTQERFSVRLESFQQILRRFSQFWVQVPNQLAELFLSLRQTVSANPLSTGAVQQKETINRDVSLGSPAFPLFKLLGLFGWKINQSIEELPNVLDDDNFKKLVLKRLEQPGDVPKQPDVITKELVRLRNDLESALGADQARVVRDLLNVVLNGGKSVPDQISDQIKSWFLDKKQGNYKLWFFAIMRELTFSHEIPIFKA